VPEASACGCGQFHPSRLSPDAVRKDPRPGRRSKSGASAFVKAVGGHSTNWAKLTRKGGLDGGIPARWLLRRQRRQASPDLTVRGGQIKRRTGPFGRRPVRSEHESDQNARHLYINHCGAIPTPGGLGDAKFRAVDLSRAKWFWPRVRTFQSFNGTPSSGRTSSSEIGLSTRPVPPRRGRYCAACPTSARSASIQCLAATREKGGQRNGEVVCSGSTVSLSEMRVMSAGPASNLKCSSKRLAPP